MFQQYFKACKFLPLSCNVIYHPVPLFLGIYPLYLSNCLIICSKLYAGGDRISLVQYGIPTPGGECINLTQCGIPSFHPCKQ
jgi:hypothetical protein